MTCLTRPEVMEKSSRELPRHLVCFSHLRWNFVFQRPQHLLTRAAKHFAVTFVEEPVYESDVVPHLKFEQADGVSVLVPILPPSCRGAEAIEAQRQLINGHLAGKDFIAWYYTPMALAFTEHLVPSLVVYDNMDELSAFKNAPAGLLDAERQMLARADIVFTGGRSLYEAKRGRHQNIHCFPSSIEAQHFGRARLDPDDPDDQRQLPRPRIGFFGVIDERMDIGLVGALADAKPEWHFILLGPVVKIDPDSLPHRPNIHWLGGKKYADLPSYLGHWDVGMMPFALNESTQFISPTKTPEFLAAGVPVVSTPVRDVVATYGERNLVAFASDVSSFVSAAESILSRTDAEKDVWVQSVDALLAVNSWDKTFAQMLGLIRQRIAEDAQDAPLSPAP